MSDVTAQTRSNWPGIGMMCLGVVLLVISDTASKLLVERYHPLQILFVRSWLALPVVVAILVALRGPGALLSPRPGVHLLRGVLAIAATYAFILGLRHLTLEGATALIFTGPLFVAAISAVIFRDPIPRDRWAAILVGFLGMLVIVRPGVAAFEPASFLPVAAAAIYGLALVLARWIDPRDGFLTVTFYITAIPAVLCSATLLLPWPDWQAGDLRLFAMVAVFGTGGISCLSHAFRLAPATVVAPFDYTALVWASALGWLVWGTPPDLWVWAGAAVIVAGGLYLLGTERRAARRARERVRPRV